MGGSAYVEVGNPLSILLGFLSKTISLSLPQGRAGVGMGLFSLLNFLSGAVATGVYGTAVDFGAESSWNPLNMFQGASAYSSIWLLMKHRYGVCPGLRGTQHMNSTMTITKNHRSSSLI